jgi:hypothetical protein
MRPLSRPLGLAALAFGLCVWALSPQNLQDTALTAVPALLGLALWGVARRSFGGPVLRWNDRALGVAVLFATGMVGTSVILGAGGLVSEYVWLRGVESPNVKNVWAAARDTWAIGAVFGGAFGLVFGAGAVLGARPTVAGRAEVSERRGRPWAWSWVGASIATAFTWQLVWEVIYDIEESTSSSGVCDTYAPAPAFRIFGAFVTAVAAVGLIAALRSGPSRANGYRAAACLALVLASALVSYHCVARNDESFVEMWALVSRDINDGPLSPRTQIAVDRDFWGEVLVVRQPGGTPCRTRLSFGPWRIDRADQFVKSLRDHAAEGLGSR